jgi:ADP-L-glycero-D-manno-heptose 6-epimerase
MNRGTAGSYVVTGAAGFIGCNIVKALNRRGVYRIIAVDNLQRSEKFSNLADCRIVDYLDKEEFLRLIDADSFDPEVDAIIHQGACSDTTESDGRYMMQNNYRYSVRLLDYCQERNVQFIYASSASVYGAGKTFEERPECEAPLNIYAYSKLLFDQHVRARHDELTCQVVGLRYFNVYGQGETHKGRMASVAWHFFQQYQESGKVKLFEGAEGYANGEQRRDFVHVDDVVEVNLHFLDRPEVSGIFNVGTGASQTFNEVAVATVNASRIARNEVPLAPEEMRQTGAIEYIPFPPALRGKYQSFTQADTHALREAGYRLPFATVQEGVETYVRQLLSARG